jgi:hypothetical protein
MLPLEIKIENRFMEGAIHLLCTNGDSNRQAPHSIMRVVVFASSRKSTVSNRLYILHKYSARICFQDCLTPRPLDNSQYATSAEILDTEHSSHRKASAISWDIASESFKRVSEIRLKAGRIHERRMLFLLYIDYGKMC